MGVLSCCLFAVCSLFIKGWSVSPQDHSNNSLMRKHLQVSSVVIQSTGKLVHSSNVARCISTCDLNFSKLVSNPCGSGGQFEENPPESEIRFGRVCGTKGEGIDLVLVSMTPYIAKPEKNRVIKSMFQLNLQAGTKATFQFRLVKSGTNEAVQVKDLIFSILDLDAHGAQHEQIIAPNYADFAMGKGVREISQSVFQATRHGTLSNNPISIKPLNDVQKELVLSLRYQDVSTWEVTFSITTGPTPDRNFFLGGATDLMPAAVCPHPDEDVLEPMDFHPDNDVLEPTREILEPMDSPTPILQPIPVPTCKICDLNFARLISNPFGNSANLQTSQPGMVIRFSEVCAIVGGGVDLLVVSMTPYTARPKVNKVVDTMFRLNLQSSTMTTFQFRLVKSGTEESITVDDLFFSILDLDGDGAERQQIIAPNYAEFTMGKGVRKINQSFFESTKKGTMCNNPTVIKPLSGVQKLSVLSLRYRSVHTWDVTFSITEGPNSDRSFFLGGATELMPATLCPPPTPIPIPSPDNDPTPQPSMIPIPTSSPTPPYCPSECNLNFANFVSGQIGNSGEFEKVASGWEIRFSKVCATNNTVIDLVVVSTTSYTAKFRNNRVLDTMFVLNLQTGTETSFKFRLVASGTDKTVLVSRLLFSVLDLDGQDATHERITAPGYSDFVKGQLVRQINTYSFESTTDGDKWDNPTSAEALDAAQKARAVSLRYRCLHTWEVTFSVTAGKQGRNFVLGGATSLMPATCQDIDKMDVC